MNKSINSLYDELQRNAPIAPLSELLPITLRLAKKIENRHLEKWVRLEMLGYIKENPALTEEIIVPEYRTVVGYHSDIYGRPLVLKNPNLSFINEERLRFDIAALEKMEKSEEFLVIHNQDMIKLIREHLDVEVHKFTFSPIMVAGVINGIRSQLLDWLYDIEEEIDQSENEKSAISELNILERKQLRQKLQTSFSETELREICFDFNIDYEGLPGRDKNEKALQLIIYFERRKQLSELKSALRELRPKISW